MSCIGSRRSQISSRSALERGRFDLPRNKVADRVANFQLFGAEVKIVHRYACPNSVLCISLLRDGGRDRVAHVLRTGFSAEVASQVFGFSDDPVDRPLHILSSGGRFRFSVLAAEPLPAASAPT